MPVRGGAGGGGERRRRALQTDARVCWRRPDIEELNELMREAARKINLKGHVVGDKLLHAPGDIEAHLGRDGRFYVVDCARVFPPEYPPPNLDEMEKGALLFKLLRPEFVQGLLSPLSSDSFSGFQVWCGRGGRGAQGFCNGAKKDDRSEDNGLQAKSKGPCGVQGALCVVQATP